MAIRTSSGSVTFARPFLLSTLDGVQPPGTYRVDTDEELLSDLSFPAYRRIAAWLWLALPSGGPGSAQMVPVDPLELETALRREAASDFQC